MVNIILAEKQAAVAAMNIDFPRSEIRHIRYDETRKSISQPAYWLRQGSRS